MPLDLRLRYFESHGWRAFGGVVFLHDMMTCFLWSQLGGFEPLRWCWLMQHVVCTVMYMVRRVSIQNCLRLWFKDVQCRIMRNQISKKESMTWNHQSTWQAIYIIWLQFPWIFGTERSEWKLSARCSSNAWTSWTSDFHTLKHHEKTVKKHTPYPKSGNNRKHTPSPSPSHKDPSGGFFLYLSTAPNGSGVEGAGHPSGASESLQFCLSGSMARHLPTPGATSPLRDSRGVAGGLVATGQVLALQKACHCWQKTLTVY